MRARKLLIQKFRGILKAKKPFPERLDPMLATKVAEPFSSADYLFEVKWDGYRIIAYKNKTVSLRSREFLDFSKTYSSVTDALSRLPYKMVLDGEVVMLDEKGKPSFDLLQQVKALGVEQLVYCVFDILWFEGYSLLDVPLIERKKLLEEIFEDEKEHLMYYPHTVTDGEGLFQQMLEAEMEGVVAKEITSTYTPGFRAKSWLKIQTRIRQEFVIGGWSESESGRPFRALIFGYYNDKGELVYFGHSGGGYTDKRANEIKAKLVKLAVKKKPFVNEVDTSTTPHWVKPVLIGEFEFATMTRSGKIRKPAIFKGLRNDKKPTDIHLDKPLTKGALKPVPLKADKRVINSGSNWPELLESLSSGSKNLLEIDERRIELNDIEKEIWPHGNITKSDLIKYYIDVSEYILPYLKDRPLSLHIKHKSVFAEGMYIKAMEGHQPEWADIFLIDRKHKRAGKSAKIDYLLCQNTETLIWLINLGCIDVNPWNSRVPHYLNPDYIIIDLDPTDSPFEEVVETAKVAKKVLDKLKLRALPKTSGKTGIHILIPVLPQFTYPQARAAATMICHEIHKVIPDITTMEDTISRRGKKVFLDDNQNDEADTIASVYSVRPYQVPNVSMPFDWKELNSKLRPENFQISTVLKRLEKKGDLFTGLFDKTLMTENTKRLTKLLSVV